MRPRFYAVGGEVPTVSASGELRAMSLAGGQQLGAHEIVGLLGAGGMGEVYRARDTS